MALDSSLLREGAIYESGKDIYYLSWLNVQKLIMNGKNFDYPQEWHAFKLGDVLSLKIMPLRPDFDNCLYNPGWPDLYQGGISSDKRAEVDRMLLMIKEKDKALEAEYAQ